MKVNIELSKTELRKLRWLIGNVYDEYSKNIDFEDYKPSRKEKKEFVNKIAGNTDGSITNECKIGNITRIIDDTSNSSCIIRCDIKSSFICGLITIYADAVSGIISLANKFTKFIEKYI